MLVKNSDSIYTCTQFDPLSVVLAAIVEYSTFSDNRNLPKSHPMPGLKNSTRVSYKFITDN